MACNLVLFYSFVFPLSRWRQKCLVYWTDVLLNLFYLFWNLIFDFSISTFFCCVYLWSSMTCFLKCWTGGCIDVCSHWREAMNTRLLKRARLKCLHGGSGAQHKQTQAWNSFVDVRPSHFHVQVKSKQLWHCMMQKNQQLLSGSPPIKAPRFDFRRHGLRSAATVATHAAAVTKSQVVAPSKLDEKTRQEVQIFVDEYKMYNLSAYYLMFISVILFWLFYFT